MARFNFIHNSFSAGEVTPKFYGRTESQQYNQSCEVLKNWIVYPEGGAGRRPGTRYIQEVTSASVTLQQTRLIPFSASDGTRWMIVLDGAGIKNANPFAVNVSTKATIQITRHQTDLTRTPGLYDTYAFDTRGISLADVQFAQSGDTLVIVHRSMKPAVIQYKYVKGQPGTFTWRGFTDPYDRGGSAANWKQLAWRQVPYLPVFTGGSYIQATRVVSGTSKAGYMLLTDGNGTAGFDATWLGRYIKLNWDGRTLVVYVYQVTDAGHALAYYVDGDEDATKDLSTIRLFGGDSTRLGYMAGSSFEMGAWDDERGWPQTVGFFEGRIIFGGTNYAPDQMWFSQIGDIYELTQKKLEQDSDFSNPIVATDAFDITLRSNLLNEIRWMLPKKNITVGTNYGEFVVSGPDQSQSIGPTNIATSQETPHGSPLVQAIPMSNTTVFLQRDRKTVREMVYNFTEDSYKAQNLSLLASHITGNGADARSGDALRTPNGQIVAMTRQEVPVGIIWAIDSNGMLLSLTRERDQDVAAWSYHELAGTGSITNEAGTFPVKPFVQSIASIQRPNAAGGAEPDEIWMTVRRAQRRGGAGGGWTLVTYLEILSPEWTKPTIDGDWVTAAEPKSAPVYMDCALIYASTAGPTGKVYVNHMSPGQTASVVLNGSYIGDYVVIDEATANPSITNRYVDISAYLTTAWNAILGYNYTAQLVPVAPTVPAAIGSSQGQTRRIDQLVINLYRALGVKFGRLKSAAEANTPVDPLEELVFPPGANSAGPIPLFSGEKKVQFPQSYETRPQVLIVSFLPFPCTVTYLVARGVVYEGGQ